MGLGIDVWDGGPGEGGGGPQWKKICAWPESHQVNSSHNEL